MRNHRKSACVSTIQVLCSVEDLIPKLWNSCIGKDDLKKFYSNRTRVQYHYVNFSTAPVSSEQLSLRWTPNQHAHNRYTDCPARRKLWGKMLLLLIQTGQIVSNLHLLKDKINTFHQINEAESFYWTDLFLGLGSWFKGVWGNVLPFDPFCFFILILIYVLFSLCRSLTIQLLNQFCSPQSSAKL